MPPSSPETRFASRSDHQHCRTAIRTGSQTFYAASKLLPFAVRQPAYGLYAFCRLSDDAIDLSGGSLDALARLQQRLDRAWEGRPLPFAADRAMADLLRRHAIPRAVPDALLEGLGWDAQGRSYETFEELQDYAARVASTVGVMMTLLMDVREPSALARACDLGVAMQLTNIARDVGEDARAGRLYLPRQWLREEGVDVAAFLAAPAPHAGVARVVARLLEAARRLYRRARAGIAELPYFCRPAILAASTIYEAIGQEIEARNSDSVSSRARVPGARKLQLLAKALAHAPRLAREPAAPPLPATAFLVEAVGRTRGAQRVRRSSAFSERFVRTLAIFERLERAEHFGD